MNDSYSAPFPLSTDSFATFIDKVESWEIPPLPEPIVVPHDVCRTSSSGATGFRGAHFGHFGGLKRWYKGAGKDAQSTFLAMTRRLWELHDEGLSTRQIARELGFKSHASVVYHLNRPRPAPNPEPEWSMATEGTPKLNSSTMQDCSVLLQRGPERAADAAPEPAELAGETQESIAGAVGYSQPEISGLLSDFADLQKLLKPLQTAALFADGAYKSALEANLRNNKARIDRWSMAE